MINISNIFINVNSLSCWSFHVLPFYFHCLVMCITHLAQVAANAHHHYRVNKYSQDKDTASVIEYLDQEQRVTELARMIGGVKLTENTYLHAQEMLETATQ